MNHPLKLKVLHLCAAWKPWWVYLLCRNWQSRSNWYFKNLINIGCIHTAILNFSCFCRQSSTVLWINRSGTGNLLITRYPSSIDHQSRFAFNLIQFKDHSLRPFHQRNFLCCCFSWLLKRYCVDVFKTIAVGSFTCADERSKLENLMTNFLFEQNVMSNSAPGGSKEFGVTSSIGSGVWAVYVTDAPLAHVCWCICISMRSGEISWFQAQNICICICDFYLLLTHGNRSNEKYH